MSQFQTLLKFCQQKKPWFLRIHPSSHHPIPSTWVSEGCCNGRFEASGVSHHGKFSAALLAQLGASEVAFPCTGAGSYQRLFFGTCRGGGFVSGNLPKAWKNLRRCTFSIQVAGFFSKLRIGSLWICKKQRPKTIVTKALNSIVRGFLVCFTKPQRSDGEALALAEGRRVIFDICWGGTPERLLTEGSVYIGICCFSFHHPSLSIGRPCPRILLYNIHTVEKKGSSCGVEILLWHFQTLQEEKSGQTCFYSMEPNYSNSAHIYII